MRSYAEFLLVMGGLEVLECDVCMATMQGPVHSSYCSNVVDVG